MSIRNILKYFENLSTEMDDTSDRNSILLNQVIKDNFGSIETPPIQSTNANQKICELDSKVDMFMR